MYIFPEPLILHLNLLYTRGNHLSNSFAVPDLKQQYSRFDGPYLRAPFSIVDCHDCYHGAVATTEILYRLRRLRWRHMQSYRGW
jgi:hypothetical protein